MDKKGKGIKMGSTRKVPEVELTPEQRKMREDLAAEFADVDVDVSVEQETTEGAEDEKPAEDNDPPITPPVEKDETDFQKFVEKARKIIQAKCPDATDLERGQYYRHATGENLNQTWAHPGAQAQALRRLRECKDPVRPEGEKKAEPPTSPLKPKVPNGKAQEKAPLTIEGIRVKYTMDYVRKNRKTGKETHSDYLVVAGRVLLLRAQAETKGYGIQTDLIKLGEDFAIMKATIADPDGTIMSTAHAMCTFAAAEFTGGRFLEKAETSAIGRALGLIGLGTEEFVADDEDGFLTDSPVEED